MVNRIILRESLMRAVFFLCAFVSVIAVVLICLFIFSGGAPAFAEIGVFKFLFGTDWNPTANRFGILPMIVGSLYVTAGAIIIGVPTAIFSAVFLARFCPKRLYGILRSGVNLLAGIPSIVYGLFGLTVIVPIMQNIFGGSGKSVLTASLILGIMILPTVIGTAESAIRAVPEAYFEGALALGATAERSVFTAVLPGAKSGIMAGVILGIGRAAGETMAVVMVAGNIRVIPGGIFDGVRTLTANVVLEMSYAADLHREALIATAAVLFVFILIINLSFSLVRRREK